MCDTTIKQLADGITSRFTEAEAAEIPVRVVITDDDGRIAAERWIASFGFDPLTGTMILEVALTEESNALLDHEGKELGLRVPESQPETPAELAGAESDPTGFGGLSEATIDEFVAWLKSQPNAPKDGPEVK